MKWISVKDKLPEEEGTYICLDYSDKSISADDIEGEYFDGERFVYWISGCEYESEGITHWMPLPKPPEDE